MKNDAYEMKKHLGETTTKQVKFIAKARMHMVEIPCNYKRYDEDGKCWFCGERNVQTEHYFGCKETQGIKKRWNTKIEDLTSNETAQLIQMSNFIRQVVDKMAPKWEINWNIQ